MKNNSTEPNIYPSINHQMMDYAIRTGQLDPANYHQSIGTTPIEEVPAYQEWKRGELKVITSPIMGTSNIYAGSANPTMVDYKKAFIGSPRCEACGKPI